MNWLEECAKEADALSTEKKQEFIDLMWKDKLNLGDASKKAGISFNAANGILAKQIEKRQYHTFNPTAK